MAVRSARGFTIIELLVVMVVIGVLMSAVMVVSGTISKKAKTTNTQALLLIVQQAVDEFQREQAANPTITRNAAYARRYGQFPPDELEVFTTTGFPRGPKHSLAVGGAAICPQPDGVFPPMHFYTRGLTPLEAVAEEHRDLAAMVLGIELFGDASSAILDGIQGRYRSPGPVDEKGIPLIFLDRPDVEGKLNKKWDEGDLQIRYIVDDWGNPVSYMTQRDWKGLDSAAETASTNHPAWNEVSSKLVQLNEGRPIIMSYGPNGTEQLSKAQMEPAMDRPASATLIADLLDDWRINSLFNEDNVYPDVALKDKLAKGVTP